MERVSETLIAAAAVKNLAPQWSEYWTEVPCETGRIDCVGRDSDGGLHAVEVKARSSLALVAQVVDRMGECAYRTVLAVVGAPLQSKARAAPDDLICVAKYIGFGVALVRNHTLSVLWPPRTLDVDAAAVTEASLALGDVHRGCMGEPGATSSKYWTLWKQGVADLERVVRESPGVNASTAQRRMATFSSALYWGQQIAQVRKMAEASKAIRIERIGRELRYYVDEATP